ncbi:major capsid protein [Lentibacter phage vB_LenP_ICBM2]|uniref:Major capsid protein n=1 Tax=Lentibacter phage vB_LenP_ICBM2 TaxID=2847823 RepID=A0A3G2YRD3_9CAUD|nr:major capsid protein [Lentibacter phage vB_LenP_ICBM2]AYP28102.1 major capsid protein [Lentibacter phage vB_LenP_ICBM2]
MAGMISSNADTQRLIRSEVYSSELKDILRDEMQAQRYVRMLDGFPDGDTFTIPTIGKTTVADYTEDAAVAYTPMDTAEFQFTVDKYLQSASYITKKAAQDSFYSAQLEARFVPEQERAIMEHFEATTFASPEVGVTANSAETLDGVAHRMSGGNGGRLELADFAFARYALKKSNVPDRNLVAVVDPSVEYQLNTLTNLVNVSNNPMWEGIVRDGIATGMRFVANVYGFDVYTSNYLKADVADSALLEKDGATGNDFSVNAGVANLFFSADATANPFVGAWRQMPEVDYEYNKDYQRHEYVTTARYGVKKYRPEGIVTVVTNPDV